jgi:hypothetical protein
MAALPFSKIRRAGGLVLFAGGVPRAAALMLDAEGEITVIAKDK